MAVYMLIQTPMAQTINIDFKQALTSDITMLFQSFSVSLLLNVFSFSSTGTWDKLGFITVGQTAGHVIVNTVPGSKLNI